MTGFPSTYRSELIDEDSNIQINTGGEETDPNVPMAAVLYQTQALLHSPYTPFKRFTAISIFHALFVDSVSRSGTREQYSSDAPRQRRS